MRSCPPSRLAVTVQLAVLVFARSAWGLPEECPPLLSLYRSAIDAARKKGPTDACPQKSKPVRRDTPSGKVAGCLTQDGTKVGWWTRWHREGQKASEGRFRNGNKHGSWRYWDAKGNLMATELFRDGREVHLEELRGELSCVIAYSLSRTSSALIPAYTMISSSGPAATLAHGLLWDFAYDFRAYTARHGAHLSLAYYPKPHLFILRSGYRALHGRHDDDQEMQPRLLSSSGRPVPQRTRREDRRDAYIPRRTQQDAVHEVHRPTT